MKISIVKPGITIAAIFIILFCWKSNGQSTYSYPLPGEDVINLYSDPMQVSTADSLFSLLSNTLFINTQQNGTSPIPLAPLNYIMDTSNFRMLYEAALSTVTQNQRNSGFITVLKIKYGIYNDQLVLFYQPLALTRVSVDTSGSTVNVTYAEAPGADTTYFTYNMGNNEVTQTSYYECYQPDSANYVANILIKHHATDNSPGTFNFSEDSTGDVRSVVYPFQEIFAGMSNNYQSANVNIYTVAMPVSVVSLSPSPFIKQDVIFGPQQMTNNSIFPTSTGVSLSPGPFANIYDDEGRMCPPECGFAETIKYPILELQ